MVFKHIIIKKKKKYIIVVMNLLGEFVEGISSNTQDA